MRAEALLPVASAPARPPAAGSGAQAVERVLSGPLGLWRGHEFAHASGSVAPSGHALLDAELPGGGWPLEGMVEVLQAQPDAPFWQLVLPALAAAVAGAKGSVALIAPPHAPFTPTFAAQGLPADRLLCIRADKPAARLWSSEQALRCADILAVLAWLPETRDAELRRLQLAAASRSRLFFMFRGARHGAASSPARLRLQVRSEGDTLCIDILKRRGPPLASPVLLPARSRRLEALLAARRVPREPEPRFAERLPRVPAPPIEVPQAAAPARPLALRLVVTPGGASAALDRAAAA